jgi:hypothetical protein
VLRWPTRFQIRCFAGLIKANLPPVVQSGLLLVTKNLDDCADAVSARITIALFQAKPERLALREPELHDKT